MPDGKKIAIGIGIASAIGAAIYFATTAEAAPPEGYVCPYCGATFSTYEELVTHVQFAHPGERIPIHIIWQ